MAIQYSIAVNNAMLDQLEVVIGTAPLLKLYTGSAPANCATAASGTLLASFTLPSDWMNNAASAIKTKLGTWSGSASNGGTIGYFRITDSGGTNVGIQGTCAIGSGDLNLDNTNVTASQVVTIGTFTLNAANT